MDHYYSRYIFPKQESTSTSNSQLDSPRKNKSNSEGLVESSRPSTDKRISGDWQPRTKSEPIATIKTTWLEEKYNKNSSKPNTPEKDSLEKNICSNSKGSWMLKDAQEP